MSKLLYEDIKRAYLDKKDDGVRLAQQLGFDFDKVFRRRSGLPLSTPMPRWGYRSTHGNTVGQRRS